MKYSDEFMGAFEQLFLRLSWSQATVSSDSESGSVKLIRSKSYLYCCKRCHRNDNNYIPYHYKSRIGNFVYPFIYR